MDTSSQTPPEGLPLVSAIVTTFNRRVLLEETLEAVLAQDYPNLELVVVDNESKDDTEDFVAKLGDSRVRYFRHANGGVIAVNRNFGASMACGEYLAFCDDDDLWLPDKISAQVDEAKRHPSAAVIGTNSIMFDGANRYGRAFKLPPETPRDASLILRRGSGIALSSAFVSREAFRASGGFDEGRELFGVEDYALWLRLATMGYEIQLIAKPLVLYRAHPGQFSSRDRRDTIAKLEKVVDKLVVDGLLSPGLEAIARRSFAVQRLGAFFREPLKRSVLLKRMVYRGRRFLDMIIRT